MREKSPNHIRVPRCSVCDEPKIRKMAGAGLIWGVQEHGMVKTKYVLFNNALPRD